VDSYYKFMYWSCSNGHRCCCCSSSCCCCCWCCCCCHSRRVIVRTWYRHSTRPRSKLCLH